MKDRRAEPASAYVDEVSRRRKLKNGVGPGTIGYRRVPVARSSIFDAHFCPNNHRALGVFNRASDAARGLSLR